MVQSNSGWVVPDAEPVLLFLIVHASLSAKLFPQSSSPPEKEKKDHKVVKAVLHPSISAYSNTMNNFFFFGIKTINRDLRLKKKTNSRS